MHTLKQLIKRVLILLFRSPLCGWLRRRAWSGRAAFILYHEIEPDQLNRHLAWFKAQGCTFITLDDFRQAMEGQAELPPKSTVITFDDGWKSNLELLPVFARYGVRPTIFICAGMIDTHRRIWNYSIPDRLGANHELMLSLWYRPNRERLAELETRFDHRPDKEYDERHMVTLEEFRAMLPHVDFQSHTLFHPVLPTCDDEELREELTASRRQIEALTGAPCYALAYPYGDHDARVVLFTREAGYSLARTARIAGLNHPADHPWRLHSIGLFEWYSERQVADCMAWAELRTLLFRNPPPPG